MNSITEKLSEKIKYLKAKYGEKIFQVKEKQKNVTPRKKCVNFLIGGKAT